MATSMNRPGPTPQEYNKKFEFDATQFGGWKVVDVWCKLCKNQMVVNMRDAQLNTVPPSRAVKCPVCKNLDSIYV